MPHKKQIEGKINSRWIQEFFCTALNCLAAVIVVYHFADGYGFTSRAIFDDLLPFHKLHGAPTNSVFLYVTGCATVFLYGIVYERFMMRWLSANCVLLTVESFYALFTVILLWFLPSKNACLLVFALHLAVLILTLRFLKNEPAREAKSIERANIAFYVVTFLVFVWFSCRYLLPGLFSQCSPARLGGVAAFCLIFFFLSLWDSRFPKFIKCIFDALVVMAIGILVFRIDTAYFDYSIILGPVNEVMFKKDILAGVLSTYGFFNIYFIAGVFKLFHVQDYYQGLSLIVSVFYLLGYSATYGIFRYFTKNVFLSVLFLLTVLNFDFYFTFIPIHWLPQVGFLRFGAYLPIFILLLLMSTGKPTRWQEGLFACCVALSMFWVMECGIYIFVSLLGVLACQYLFWHEKEKIVWLRRMAAILLALGIIASLVSVRIYLKYHQWPHWADLFHFQKTYAQSGLAMEQLKSLGLWVIPVFIYFLTIYVCLKYEKQLVHKEALLFLSFFGLMVLLYFINKQGLTDLARVVLPALIISVIVFESVFQKNRYLLCFLAIMVFATVECSVDKEGKRASFFYFLSHSSKNFTERLKIPSLAFFLKDQEAFTKFQYDLESIRRLTATGEPLAIFSKIDTLYYIYTPRPSLFNNSFYAHFHLNSELKKMANEVLQSRVRYLFVDNSPFQCYNNMVSSHGEAAFFMIKDSFVKRARLGFLDVYERKK